ncbi:hypothetical protein ScPMuIL_015323 [Solemya velum]
MEKIIVQVDRDSVFSSAVKYLQGPDSEKRPLEVRFQVDEHVEDTVNLGGPNKEFFTLFFKAVIKKEHDMFERVGPYVLPVGNRGAIDKELFTILGKAIVVSLCCGGPPFLKLAPYILSYIRGHEYLHQLDLSLVNNSYLREYIQKIERATTQEEIDQVIGEDQERFMENCGWSNGEMVTLDKVGKYIQVLLIWELVSKRKESLDQIKLGLNTLHFLEHVRDMDWGELEKILCVHDSQERTAKYVRQEISKATSSLECCAIDEHNAKKYTLSCLEDLTVHHGDGHYPYSDYPIEVNFNRADRSAKLPEASTCVFKLFIPLGNESKLKFYSSFNAALVHGRLGFAGRDN